MRNNNMTDSMAAMVQMAADRKAAAGKEADPVVEEVVEVAIAKDPEPEESEYSGFSDDTNDAN